MKIEVDENNTVVVPLTVTRRFEGGETTPLDLSVFDSLEFFAKKRRTNTDAEAIATYRTSGLNPRIVITNALGGKLEIEVQAADTDQPGRYPCHLDGLTAAKRRTIGRGVLIVRNV